MDKRQEKLVEGGKNETENDEGEKENVKIHDKVMGNQLK